jgi:predicted nucleotidyltransferase
MEHERVRRVFLDGAALQIAILFGSRARGAARPDSDMDLAILPVDPELPRRDENEFVAELERATGAQVDLVHLGPRRYRAHLAASHPESTR